MSIAISIDGRFLDLSPEFNLTMDYEGVQEAGKVKGSGSNTITIPLTEKNKRILGDIYDLDTQLETTRAFADTVRCTAHYEGNEFLQGILVLDSWTDTEVKAQFLSTAANWAEALDRPLKDVNRGVGGAIEDRWKVVYNVCDWLTAPGRSGRVGDGLFETHTWIATAYGYKGAFSFNGANVLVDFTQQRPSLFVYPLLVAHFEQAGYTLQSQFLEDISNLQRDDVLPLALPQVTNAVFGVPEIGVPETLQARISQSADTPTPSCPRNDFVAYFDTVDSDPAGITGTYTIDGCTIDPGPFPTQPEAISVTTMRITKEGRYRLTGEILIDNTGVVGADIWFIETGSGNLFSSQVSPYTNAVNGTTPVQIGSDIDVYFDVTPQNLNQAGGSLEMVVWATCPSSAGNTVFKAGSFLELYTLNQISENDTYDIRDTAPDVTALNLWSAVVKAFNLKVYTDEINKRVIAEPFGEFFDLSHLPDLSQQINRAEPFKQERISPNKKGLNLLWAKDDDDALHENYEHPQQGLAESELALGSRIVLPEQDNEFDTVKIEEFAGTFNDTLYDEGAIQVLWFRVIDENPYAEYEWLPRIVQVQTATLPEAAKITSVQPPDGTCSGAFPVAEFTEYVRGFFAGTLPSGTGNPDLPNPAPQYTLSYYSTNEQNSYDRFYRQERLQSDQLRKIKGQLLLNKGRTIEEFIRYNLLWQLDNQIAQINKVGKHNVGKSNLVEAEFTILKGLDLLRGDPYVPTPVQLALPMDGVNNALIMGGDYIFINAGGYLTPSNIVTDGDNISLMFWVYMDSATPGGNRYIADIYYRSFILPTPGSKVSSLSVVGTNLYTANWGNHSGTAATAPFTLDQWSQVVLNKTTNSTQLFVNKVPGTLRSYPATPNYNGAPVPDRMWTTIGQGFDGAFNYMVGGIAHVVAQFTPFTSADIDAHFALGCGDLAAQFPNAQAVIYGNETTLSQTDNSGNSNPALMTGVTAPITLINGVCP